jgi:hypothetical protein
LEVVALGSVRERWICRSELPVRMYVPPWDEKVRQLMGALWDVSVFRRWEGMVEEEDMVGVLGGRREKKLGRGQVMLHL